MLPDTTGSQKSKMAAHIPEIIISWWREEMSTWCQRLRHSFQACLIHFYWYRHRPTSENSIGNKPEVETVPQTGITNNLATGTDIDAISVPIPVFGATFSLVYNADLNRRFLHPEIPRWWTYTGSSYNFVTENNIKVILAAGAMFYICVATEIV